MLHKFLVLVTVLCAHSLPVMETNATTIAPTMAQSTDAPTTALTPNPTSRSTAYHQSYYHVQVEELYVSLVYDILGECRAASLQARC
jgi:hypothetical protein